MNVDAVVATALPFMTLEQSWVRAGDSLTSNTANKQILHCCQDDAHPLNAELNKIMPIRPFSGRKQFLVRRRWLCPRGSNRGKEANQTLSFELAIVGCRLNSLQYCSCRWLKSGFLLLDSGPIMSQKPALDPLNRTPKPRVPGSNRASSRLGPFQNQPLLS